jgi:hypothetical protein
VQPHPNPPLRAGEGAVIRTAVISTLIRNAYAFLAPANP